MMNNATGKVKSLARCKPRTQPFIYVLLLTVIRQCALDKDLELFEAGDATEVGEKGLTLRFVS